MTITLGFTPNQLQVTLARGGGFTQAFRSAVPWPDGTTITLTFAVADDTPPVATWTATLTETVADGTTYYDAVLSETDDTVLTVITAGARHARLLYEDGSGADIVWGKGRVGVA